MASQVLVFYPGEHSKGDGWSGISVLSRWTQQRCESSMNEICSSIAVFVATCLYSNCTENQYKHCFPLLLMVYAHIVNKQECMSVFSSSVSPFFSFFFFWIKSMHAFCKHLTLLYYLRGLFMVRLLNIIDYVPGVGLLVVFWEGGGGGGVFCFCCFLKQHFCSSTLVNERHRLLMVAIEAMVLVSLW